MKTESILIQNLCVPCGCHCRYCLLSWDGRPVGTDWERSQAFVRRFKAWQLRERPDLTLHFTFGYSMEHPRPREALAFLREIGSPQAEYFQCDGLAMRDATACRELADMLRAEGMEHLNFTLYGLPPYHDRFAGRPGDFALNIRLMKAAAEAGLRTSCGIPLTRESAPQAEELIRLIREEGCCEEIFLFVPHSEGRGSSLHPIRFRQEDFEALSPEVQSLLNTSIYKPEGEWLAGAYQEETGRSLLLSLRADNMDRYEAMKPEEIIEELEAMDEAYYGAFPSFSELAALYGDPRGSAYYRQRDLFHHYRQLYAREQGISIYDVTDERQSGSRRY